jgi:hypothetical protein
MAEYFYQSRRKRYIFDPESKEPYRLSRTKLADFLNCRRCFWLDRRQGVAAPPGFVFNLNIAVDQLLKREFDLYREMQKPHPVMVQHGIDAVPFRHESIDEWRDSLHRGVQYLHEPTNLLVTGGIDDIWQALSDKALHVVDYKATSKREELKLDAVWQDWYKRQAEIYQWLFRKAIGVLVSDEAYFVYCNAFKADDFDQVSSVEKSDEFGPFCYEDKEANVVRGRLDFEIAVVPYVGSDDWIEETLFEIRKTLMSTLLPQSGLHCQMCKYRKEIVLVLGEQFQMANEDMNRILTQFQFLQSQLMMFGSQPHMHDYLLKLADEMKKNTEMFRELIFSSDIAVLMRNPVFQQVMQMLTMIEWMKGFMKR